MREADIFQGAANLARSIAEGRLSSADLVEACLARIDRHDASLRAFASLDREGARITARGLDALRDAGHLLGPLHGVPVALKDLIEIEGAISSNGMPTRKVVSTRTAEIVEHLRQAGMIILGKTAMVECAFGGWGTNAGAGTPRNPWDAQVHRVPGGSSSGSAVAVAAGLVPLAIGTDTGGSVRIPASLCGTVGFKPSFGAIPTDGVLPLSSSLDTVGLLAMTVEDAALAFGILSCRRSGGPEGTRRPYRFGIPARLHEDGIDAQVQRTFDEALSAFGAAGAEMVSFDFDAGWDEMLESVGVIISSEGLKANSEVLNRVSDAAVLSRLKAGASHSAYDYLVARERMGRARTRAGDRLADLDAVVTPTTPIAAPPLDEVDETRMPLSHYTRAVNYLGLCACSLPIGRTTKGLPTGLQLIGKAGQDQDLLALASWCESVLPVPDRTDIVRILT